MCFIRNELHESEVTSKLSGAMKMQKTKELLQVIVQISAKTIPALDSTNVLIVV